MNKYLHYRFYFFLFYCLWQCPLVAVDNEKQIITFIPAGMGSIDLSIAYCAYLKAKKQNVGKELDLFE